MSKNILLLNILRFFVFKYIISFVFKNFKNLFGIWNWFEILLMILGLISSITLTVIFKSTILDCITFIILTLYCLLTAKGKVLGLFIGLLSSVLYIITSLNAHYYGEVLISATLEFPAIVWCIFQWIKNKRYDEKQGQIVIVNKLSLKEILLAVLFTLIISFGLYFLLKYFNTNFLILSTISASIGVLANYLTIRRSEFCWIPWILKSGIIIVLWLNSTIFFDISYITLTTMSVFVFIINTYGFINWIHIKKRQKNS